MPMGSAFPAAPDRFPRSAKDKRGRRAAWNSRFEDPHDDYGLSSARRAHAGCEMFASGALRTLPRRSPQSRVACDGDRRGYVV
jgi:hypothetical protein